MKPSSTNLAMVMKVRQNFVLSLDGKLPANKKISKVTKFFQIYNHKINSSKKWEIIENTWISTEKWTYTTKPTIPRTTYASYSASHQRFLILNSCIHTAVNSCIFSWIPYQLQVTVHCLKDKTPEEEKINIPPV